MRGKLRGSAGLIMILLMGTLVGCSRTAPARFYTLSDMPGAELKAPASRGKPCITLGIGPVEVPEYLDRPQIVTQVNANQLQLGDFDQWAEPLGKSVMRTLADNLATLLCVEEIVYYPGESAGVDYQVVVTVTRFHGLTDGTVALSAQWQVKEGAGGKVVARNRAAIRKAIEGDGYSALAAAHSSALAELSREIAEAVSNATNP